MSPRWIGAHRQQRALERGRGRREDELVDQQVIADQQVRLHRAGRDLERLEDERAHEQREDHGDDDRLEVLAQRGLLEGRFRHRSFVSDLQHRQERFLRNLHGADALHALLAFLLLLEQLALARDVAAVALGQHVLAQRLDRFARDDAGADRRLDRHLEHLPRDQLAHLRRQHAGRDHTRGRDGR